MAATQKPPKTTQNTPQTPPETPKKHPKTPDGRWAADGGTYIGEPKYRFDVWSVLGRFPAKVGPGTVTNGPGLQKCCINQWHQN